MSCALATVEQYSHTHTHSQTPLSDHAQEPEGADQVYNKPPQEQKATVLMLSSHSIRQDRISTNLNKRISFTLTLPPWSYNR